MAAENFDLSQFSHHAELPDLPYDFNALEPVISAQIMELHYSKHHNTYVTKFNEAMDQLVDAQEKGDFAKMIQLEPALRFNGGGHINHSIFWTNLAPKNKGGGQLHEGPLKKELEKTFGSIDNFKQEFNTKTAAIQGSGWGWLGFNEKRKGLYITTCANQDPLATKNLVPLLGVDVWEHAYYLQYKNVRPDYLKAIWEIVNWKNVEERFLKGVK